MPNLGWWRSWTPARTLRTHCTHTGPGRRPSSSTLCSTSTPPSKMCTCHPPALSGRRHFWIQRDGVCPRPLRCCQRPVSPGGNEVGGSGALPNSTKHLVCAGLALVPLHPLAPLVLSTALKGASKTHTMLRMDAGPGIYLQMLTDLFQAVEETRESTDCSVSMSCLEIYNEVIWDLLKPSSGFLDLREDSRGSIQIAGIAEVSASNTQELRVTGAHGGTCGSSTSATLTSAHRAEPDTQLQSCFRAKGTANFCITSPLSSPVLRADITNGSRTLPSASRCMERVATQGPLTICPLLLLSSDHAAPHQRQLAVHTGVHRHQQDVVPLPRRAAGHRAPAQPRHRHGRGSAHWEALHGGPGGLGAGASDPEPRQEDEGGRPHQPLPAGAGQRHQRAQREGRQPGAVRELPGRKLTRACCRCPSWGSQLALTLATSRHQVKRNLLNVSYHIAQYADVISDLGRQIKHPKAKVEKQEKEKRSIPEADTLQVALLPVQLALFLPPAAIPPPDTEEDSRLQMKEIRVQLIGGFKEQLEMRRSPVELESTSLELHVDVSHYLPTMAEALTDPQSKVKGPRQTSQAPPAGFLQEGSRSQWLQWTSCASCLPAPSHVLLWLRRTRASFADRRPAVWWL
ncbi:uncharacterized protein LOC118881463 isoform X5 [Balaenoptera musculus]|uniref:Uncharacterized protein LOC118881463 isoform X5 n=1 Tax=Balaenoptera musculus TaxID=9771 RepID=A0A8B8VBZ5_BALMU|nr:uncharacterized protein LOC118881463 isoform X5 [Balaenoptera musculus]